MTALQKAIMATVALVACIASLTVLALAHVEGAALAVTAIVTAIVGYYTREARSGEEHRKNTPTLPPGDGLLILFAAAGISALMSGGCSLLGGDKAAQAENAYKTQQLACVAQYETRDQIEACRQKVREEWGIVETATAKDGGK